jgi:nucleoside-diphosphate-sugar epimerase
MRLVIVGATGNVGTSLLRAVKDDAEVESVLGLARRRPELVVPKTEWAQADIRDDELVSHFRGADCVVHLAWSIQPSRDLTALWRTNVDGSSRVFRAVAEAGVTNLVYASSIGAYSPAPKDRAVDETWPTGGVPTSFYSRHKAEVERRLDRFEREHPDVRVVRLRPGLIFKRESAAEQRRLFAGPFLPGSLIRPSLIPLVPDIPDLRFQAVHSYDIGEAYRLAVTANVRGAFNVAAEPVVDSALLAELFRARKFPVPAGLVRRIAELTWRLRLQPTPAGWVDMALNVPIMDTTRARDELGWRPRHSATDALRDLVRGLNEAAGIETPPLAAKAGGRARERELAQGVGARDDA